MLEVVWKVFRGLLGGFVLGICVLGRSLLGACFPGNIIFCLVWMKDLVLPDLTFGFDAKFHPQGQTLP